MAEKVGYVCANGGGSGSGEGTCVEEGCGRNVPVVVQGSICSWDEASVCHLWQCVGDVVVGMAGVLLYLRPVLW